MGIDLTPANEESLRAYCRMLAEDADLLGLTAKRGEQAIWDELVLDALTGVRHLGPSARVLDLGSGGGIPGIPLQIALPDSRFCLVESNGRKATFLKKVSASLALPCEIQPVRSEELALERGYREKFDHVTAKAVSSLRVLVELAMPFLRKGGTLLAYKGPSIEAEIGEAAVALRELRAEVSALKPYTLGERSYFHCIVTKIDTTPKKYPRRAGIPAHQPL